MRHELEEVCCVAANAASDTNAYTMFDFAQHAVDSDVPGAEKVKEYIDTHWKNVEAVDTSPGDAFLRRDTEADERGANVFEPHAPDIAASVPLDAYFNAQGEHITGLPPLSQLPV